ncbi:MAG: RHS repeat-associated core domain-containing protein [Proteobacteria bacterium]|nr:RHS repeat-associated core domain-containing protein [Pseudomonadota bacterium]MBU2454989.1 RHS repeat-associated core domain-containing protein [Pseudomonadota bacterium]MBU2628298.1 RHS repeat-associated core domain-containing protein [Pseudomonadota bacterium]
MYSPTLRRFIQKDPAGYVDGLNLYAYVLNNPLRFTDPDGLMARDRINALSDINRVDHTNRMNYVPQAYSAPAPSYQAPAQTYKAYVPEADYSISTSSYKSSSPSLDLGVLVEQKSNNRLGRGSSFTGESVLVADATGTGTSYDLISASQSLHNNEYSVKKISDQIEKAFYKRKKDTIYITGHDIGIVGPTHTAIEYKNKRGDSSWISAGPDTGILRSGEGKDLRPSDQPQFNYTVGIVIPPKNVTAKKYMGILKQAEKNFRKNTLDYDLFPGIMDGQNSNSFTVSIIRATGGKINVDMSGFIGANKIIPEKYFKQ